MLRKSNPRRALLAISVVAFACGTSGDRGDAGSTDGFDDKRESTHQHDVGLPAHDPGADQAAQLLEMCISNIVADDVISTTGDGGSCLMVVTGHHGHIATTSAMASYAGLAPGYPFGGVIRADLLAGEASLAAANRRLLDLALERGGGDNISILLMRVRRGNGAGP